MIECQGDILQCSLHSARRSSTPSDQDVPVLLTYELLLMDSQLSRHQWLAHTRQESSRQQQAAGFKLISYEVQRKIAEVVLPLCSKSLSSNPIEVADDYQHPTGKCWSLHIPVLANAHRCLVCLVPGSIFLLLNLLTEHYMTTCLVGNHQTNISFHVQRWIHDNTVDLTRTPIVSRILRRI